MCLVELSRYCPCSLWQKTAKHKTKRPASLINSDYFTPLVGEQRTQMFFFEYSGSLWWICWVWKDPIPALKDSKRPPVGGSSRHNGTVASPSAELGQGPAKELGQCREEDGRTVRMRRDSATCCNMKCHGPRSSFCRKQVAEKCWVETNETGKVESQGSYY